MDKQQINILPVYQSANSNDYDSVKNNFIVRRVEYEIIMDSLLNKSDNVSVQHELILGRRGSGKSTLLKRVEAEIAENKKLKNKYIPVNPAEEQAGIYRLMDLWEQVLLELSCKLGIEIRLKNFSGFAEEQDYSRYLYSEIHKICVQKKKKAVLLLDNFDRIVGNFTDDGNLLRETLINFNDLVIIAASTRMDEHFWQYDQPFYEFFRKHHLQTLNSAETFQLLEHWSKVLNRPQIKDFINKFPGKVENVRLLTDGLPRTMQFFMEIVLQNEKSVDIDFLQKIMDEATPQYQERLINETPPMRKILLEMAFIWEACSTKQLAEKCKMTSKLVSANLKTLAARNLVDLITTDKRYHLYRISERFFNMWLIVTQGNPEQKRKARWVSIFLENWYDACELQELAKQHISRLKENKLSYKEAIILSKGLSLSKSISTFDRDKMIELTEAIADKKENYLMELPETFKKIKERINNYVDKGNLKKAHELANSIENEEDGWKYNIQGNIYATETSYKEAEKYYLSAIEKDDNDALFNLALLYFNQGKNELAEKYYLLAIENGNNKALNNLALLYISQGKYEVAEKYYLLAIEKEINEALWNLSGMYYVQNRKKEEVKQYLHKYKGNNTFLIIIEIWLGIFNDVENRVTAAFKENTDNQSDLIERLLIHHQKTLVNKLFEHAEFGNKLQEQYKPLYYVCRILNGKADENNLMLRIPPELDSTVKAILNRIEELQKFYE